MTCHLPMLVNQFSAHVFDKIHHAKIVIKGNYRKQKYWLRVSSIIQTRGRKFPGEGGQGNSRQRINPRHNGDILHVCGKAKDSLERSNGASKRSGSGWEELTSLQGGGTKVKLSFRHVDFQGTKRNVQWKADGMYMNIYLCFVYGYLIKSANPFHRKCT